MCGSVLSSPISLVAAKAPGAEVTRACRTARGTLLAAFEVTVTPTEPPDLVEGGVLFAKVCASCHGPDGGGDGPAGTMLRPRPRSFLDPDVMVGLSPLRAFNAVTDGIPRTAMASFSALSEQERWNLAFFVFTLRHPSATGASSSEPGDLDLQAMTMATDGELLARLPADLDAPTKLARLGFLRRHPPASGHTATVDRAATAVTEARGAYLQGKSARARELLDEAYLDGFEPVEGRLRVTAPSLVASIEERFLELRDGQRGLAVQVGQGDARAGAADRGVHDVAHGAARHAGRLGAGFCRGRRGGPGAHPDACGGGGGLSP
jgi:high-affinity iron transporter